MQDWECKELHNDSICDQYCQYITNMQSLHRMAKRIFFSRAIRNNCFRFSEKKSDKPADTPDTPEAARPEGATQQPVGEESFSDF